MVSPSTQTMKQTQPITPTTSRRIVTLPAVTPLSANPQTREEVLFEKKQHRLNRLDDSTQARDKSLDPEIRGQLMNSARRAYEQEQHLEDTLQRNYVPQHGPRQFISPRVIFRTPLFRVASRSAPRKAEIELILAGEAVGEAIRYVGPELRQTEGLVFMSLLHMLRDLPAGTAATFSPKELYVSLFGHYDGRSRPRLASAIRRLLRGQIVTKHYTVQLCHRFEHPAKGPWTVAIDPDIVRLFATSNVWVAIDTRVSLPEGLATWLYGYIKSQSRLIPTRIDELRRLCGTDACLAAFTNSLRRALEHLNAHDVIDSGYKISNGSVRWRKTSALQGEIPR